MGIVRELQAIDERFWDRVGKARQCWEWMGTLAWNGYGIFKLAGKTYRAHRWLWEQLNGPIPEGLLVCHRCDNRSCVNPEHLFLGTPQDNSSDASRKKRLKVPHFRGEEHYRAQLTESDVLAIRESYAKGGLTQAQIAQRYKVSRDTISSIINRKSWRHV